MISHSFLLVLFWKHMKTALSAVFRTTHTINCQLNANPFPNNINKTNGHHIQLPDLPLVIWSDNLILL
jgi:hypothetical protein